MVPERPTTILRKGSGRGGGRAERSEKNVSSGENNHLNTENLRLIKRGLPPHYNDRGKKGRDI